MSTPDSMQRVANRWRKSWWVMRFTLASFAARSMDFWHSKTCITGFSGNSPGRPARIFSSNCRRLLFSGIHRAFPFLVTRTCSRPLSNSTSPQRTCRASSIRRRKPEIETGWRNRSPVPRQRFQCAWPSPEIVPGTADAIPSASPAAGPRTWPGCPLGSHVQPRCRKSGARCPTRR